MRFYILIAAISLLVSAASAVQPGLDDGEFLIDTAGVYSERNPTVAFDGTNFLAVWEGAGNDGDISGARIAPTGEVLDPSGFPVSAATGWQAYPAPAFDGTNFLVVWEDHRSQPPHIYGARVTPAGVVLDTAGIAISTAGSYQWSPALAFDGTNFFVVWAQDQIGGYDIYGTRVTPAGKVLDTAGIAISPVTGKQYDPAIAFDGTNLLVVWTDTRGGTYEYDIYGARVTPQGKLLDSLGIAISTGAGPQFDPAMTFDGTNFLVVWADQRSGGAADVYGARVTPAGVVLDTAGTAISPTMSYGPGPDLAFDGTNFFVAWADAGSGGTADIYGARVSQSGVVFDEGPVVTQEHGQVNPTLARGADNQMFLVYQGWADTVAGKIYEADRIWGKLGPFIGIEENPKPQASSPRFGATIVRGVLFLPSSPLSTPHSLLSIEGRKVLDLLPGANDVSRLTPGVYFVRTVSREPSAVSCRKVVIAR